MINEEPCSNQQTCEHFKNKMHTELNSFNTGLLSFFQSPVHPPWNLPPAHSLQCVHSFYLTQTQTSKRFLLQALTGDPALPVIMVLPQAPLDGVCSSDFPCFWWQLWRVLVRTYEEWTWIWVYTGNGNPLQYSCLENPMVRAAWSRRVGHDWTTSLSLFTFMHWRRKWQPTPVFLPGESQGRGSLLGCRLWGRTESDTTEAT